MKCARCQHENPPEARFCEECAAPLQGTCANCGAPLRASAKFCPACAHPVTASAPTSQRFGAPEAYTPKHLAEKILTSKSALEGEHKLVTVLFCDIANSTALAVRVGAEGMHETLNAFFELALAEIWRTRATLGVLSRHPRHKPVCADEVIR